MNIITKFLFKKFISSKKIIRYKNYIFNISNSNNVKKINEFFFFFEKWLNLHFF